MYILKQRVHPTWFLTVGCIGFVMGIGLAQYSGSLSVLVLFAGIGAATTAAFGRRAWMLGLMLTGGLMAGAWRGALEKQDLQAYSAVIGKQVVLRGRVNADPQSAKGEKQAVVIGEVSIQNMRLAGQVYVTVDSLPRLRRGDSVMVEGKVTPSRGAYAASIYDAKMNHIERPDDIALTVRDAMSEAIRADINEPMASLGIGFLVGQKSELPNDFTEALKIAGLTHIVVASGYNLTILVRLARRAFEKLSKYQAALLSVAMIAGFMAITGWSASMTRAGLVAGLSLWAWYYGRAFHPVTLLAFAAAVTTVIYPAYAWGDLGWALSFAAFAGVIVLAPLLHAFFYGDEKPGFVAQIFIETVAAQIMTLPILLGAFGKFSIIALVSNILVLPLVPLAMLLSFLVGMCQLLVPAAAHIAAMPAGIVLGYMVWVVEWTAKVSWAQIFCPLPWWGVLLAYSVIAGACIYLKRSTHYNLRQVNVVE